jgi:hypothetical protein
LHLLYVGECWWPACYTQKPPQVLSSSFPSSVLSHLVPVSENLLNFLNHNDSPSLPSSPFLCSDFTVTHTFSSLFFFIFSKNLNRQKDLNQSTQMHVPSLLSLTRNSFIFAQKLKWKHWKKSNVYMF